MKKFIHTYNKKYSATNKLIDVNDIAIIKPTSKDNFVKVWTRTNWVHILFAFIISLFISGIVLTFCYLIPHEPAHIAGIVLAFLINTAPIIMYTSNKLLCFRDTYVIAAEDIKELIEK